MSVEELVIDNCGVCPFFRQEDGESFRMMCWWGERISVYIHPTAIPEDCPIRGGGVFIRLKEQR